MRTFARCPHVRHADGVDVAAVGVPFDTATSFRPGARFGPEAIRSASVLLRPWHPVLEVDVFSGPGRGRSGDLDVTPGNAARTAEQVAAGLAPLLAAGVVPIVLGGDHSIALGELRAHAEAAGEPVALVLLDAHADTWDQYYGERHFHGTVFRRAVEEGVVAPERSVLAGMRGPLYEAADIAAARELGFDVIADAELQALGTAGFSSRVRGRAGDGPVVLRLRRRRARPGVRARDRHARGGGPAAPPRRRRSRSCARSRECGSGASTWSRCRRRTTGRVRGRRCSRPTWPGEFLALSARAGG